MPDQLETLALRTRRIGRAYRFLAVCASTNDEAARIGDPDGLVVVADAQTGGRGRLGRAWHSPPGANLHVSILLRPAIAAHRVPPLTLLVGAVTAQVLQATGARPQLKWPNDVLLATGSGHARKVAGILTEMASERDRVRHVVVGIGLNVNTLSFPAALEARATSLCAATGREHDRRALLVALLEAFEPAYDRFCADGPADAIAHWRSYGALGQPCRIERDGTVVEGTAEDIDPDGALVLRDGHGHIHRVVSGEIV